MSYDGTTKLELTNFLCKQLGVILSNWTGHIVVTFVVGFNILLDTFLLEFRPCHLIFQVKKEMLLDPEELKRFHNHSSQMAALDFMVSTASDTFIPTYDGNMAKLVEGHRR